MVQLGMFLVKFHGEMLFVKLFESEMRMWSISFAHVRAVLLLLPISAILVRFECDFKQIVDCFGLCLFRGLLAALPLHAQIYLDIINSRDFSSFPYPFLAWVGLGLCDI